MYSKIGLGIHNIPPAPIVKLKIQDKNPSYKCDIKVPLLKNTVQVNRVKFSFHREAECNLTPLTASYCCPELAPNSPPLKAYSCVLHGRSIRPRHVQSQ
jgi:hypothetical protein